MGEGKGREEEGRIGKNLLLVSTQRDPGSSRCMLQQCLDSFRFFFSLVLKGRAVFFSCFARVCRTPTARGKRVAQYF